MKKPSTLKQTTTASKQPSKRKSSSNRTASQPPQSDDDVRSSLDLLDSVIGEFDDGLLSAAESEYGGGGHGHGGGGRIEAEIRKRPPPKSKAMGSSNKDPLNQSEPPLKPAQTGPNGVSLTEKIDDIFSELTEEIYSADKQQKIMLRSESTNSDSAGRKLSPIRRVNDPLPTPPASSTRKIAGKDEVVVYADKMERPKEVIPLKRSVKAQIHSLETRGRHHRVITTGDSVNELENSKENSSNGGMGMAVAVKTSNGNQNPTFTKNNPNRSRSENPPKTRSATGHGHRENLGNPMSLAPTLEDDFASRVNVPSSDPSKQRHSANKAHPPPPMPEKTKIHLRNNEPTKTTSSNKKTTKNKASDKVDKASNNKNQRQRRPDQPLPELPNSNEPSSLPSSHPYEVLPSEAQQHMTKARLEQYKRSKSLGPVVEAAQRELLASAAAARERQGERSRSRGPIESNSKEGNTKSSKTKSKTHQRSSNNFNDGEVDNLSGGDRHSNGNDPRKSRQSVGAFRPKEGNSLESSRGRSRIKTNVERSVSTTVANSSKKPIKVDVMDPFLVGNSPHNHGPAGHGPILPPSRMPARQKSMIDLREPSWPDQPHHHGGAGGGGVGPPQVHHHPQLQPRLHPHQFQHQMMHNHGGRHGTPPRGLFPPDMQQSLPPQHAPHQSRQGLGQPPSRPPMMRSATEHDIKIRNRRSMAVGPFEDLPPHIRQHMARQHPGFRFGPNGEADPAAAAGFAFGAGSGNRRPPGPLSTRDRQLAEEDAKLVHHLTLESQREFLMRRGFSPSHPYITGEVPIHPELQGRLPFHVPSRTIPLRPDDYQRFKPEYWLQNHNPNPVAFTDLAVLQSELELKRRRELHRQNSQKAAVAASAAVESRQRNSPRNSSNPAGGGGVASAEQQSRNYVGDGQENNFNSLPWEEIIPRRVGGVPVLPPEHLHQQPPGGAAVPAKENSRSKSQDTRPKEKRSGLFSGAGWFNPGHVWREAEPDVRGLGGNSVKQQGHWLLKERDSPMVSMPPNIDTLRDSGIGLAPIDKYSEAKDVGVSENQLNRNEPKRSSFGMALKDKFNKNPNMYFPAPIADSRSDSRTENNSSRTGSHKGGGGHGDRGSSKSGSGSGRKSARSGSPSKTTNSLMMVNPVVHDDLSDTDTLIHNMSDGSYEKDSGSSMELDTGDHDSFGSAKGSRSSGNSSLSPHNSMEGSPRMLGSTQSSSLGTHTGSQFPVQSGASPSVSLMGKKTIRNYTPKESTALLREFEDRRNNSVDWRNQPKPHKNSRSQQQENERSSSKPGKPTLERKSSMERMIDDFHKSLPPPPSNGATAAVAAATSTKDSTMISTSATANSSKKQSKNGTMNSQISNWSAASSAASFDYQPGNGNNKHNAGSPGLRKSRSTDLPSVDENDYDQDNDDDDDDMDLLDSGPARRPQGERVPPEGAASATGVSPTNFVHRIVVKSTNNAKRNSPSPVEHSSPQRRKSSSAAALARASSDAIAAAAAAAAAEDMLPPPPPPPPPVIPVVAPPPAVGPNEDKDDFSNLRKLISEGRIAGLNAPPPSFIPPSPPAASKESSKRGADRSASASRRPSSAKPPAPSTPKTPKTPKTSHSAERQPSRKNREAPKPPMQSNVSTPSSEIKFVSSRNTRESMEDLTQMNGKKRSEVKRSSSNHGTRPSGFDSHIDDLPSTTAQLIADSTEKKFNFNPFKGKLFKKKQYSFDFH